MLYCCNITYATNIDALAYQTRSRENRGFDVNSNEDQELVGTVIDDKGVLTLELNRPESYNSLSNNLIQALYDQLELANEDDSVRVLVIRGRGRGFCSGHDLDEVISLKCESDQYKLLGHCARLMQAIHVSPKPVITQVHGIAYAAGCQLVASSDLAFSTEDARFATPGVNIGLFCSTPMVALSRAVADKHALRMLLTGESISAKEAVDIGLINEAVRAERIDVYVQEIARTIASKSSHVVQMGKVAFRQQLSLPLQDAYELCNDVVVENLKASDAREGVAAFLEKRQPQWKDS